jgi:hypothetical protein
LAQDGNRAGAVRTKRRRVGGMGGVFIGVVAFYRVEAWRGRAGVPSWPTFKEAFNAAGYWRIEEGRGAV